MLKLNNFNYTITYVGALYSTFTNIYLLWKFCMSLTNSWIKLEFIIVYKVLERALVSIDRICLLIKLSMIYKLYFELQRKLLFAKF